MIQLNKKITISSSIGVEQPGLESLAGRTGEVVMPITRKNGTVVGAWIELDGEPFMSESEWFIPISSILV